MGCSGSKSKSAAASATSSTPSVEADATKLATKLSKEAIEEVKKILAPVKAETVFVTAESSSQQASAKKLLDRKVADFTTENPDLVLACEKLGDGIEAQTRCNMVAFYCGFCEGLARTKLDPAKLVEALTVDLAAIMIGIEAALEPFVQYAAKQSEPVGGDGMLEVAVKDIEGDAMKTKMFFEKLLPVALNLLKALKDLKSLAIELAAPVLVVEHIVKMATPPLWALAEQAVKDAFSIAWKKNRDDDVAAVHELISAWERSPRPYPLWLNIGQSLGTLCEATVGDGF